MMLFLLQIILNHILKLSYIRKVLIQFYSVILSYIVL